MGMAMMETSIFIARPIETVFQFLLNPDQSAPAMDPAGGSVAKTPEGPPGPGTTFVFRQRNFGRVMETKTHYTAVEPNRKIEFDAEIGPMRPRCSLTFEATEGGTKVIFKGNSNPRGPAKLLAPLMNRMGQKNWTWRLTRVKEILESIART
jgi:uncharacterized protein YndB with AHSA1/START domain